MAWFCIAGVLHTIYQLFLPWHLPSFYPSVPVYLIDSGVKKRKRYVMESFAGLFTGLGFWAVYTSLVMQQTAAISFGMLVVAAVVFFWVSAIMG